MISFYFKLSLFLLIISWAVIAVTVQLNSWMITSTFHQICFTSFKSSKCVSNLKSILKSLHLKSQHLVALELDTWCQIWRFITILRSSFRAFMSLYINSQFHSRMNSLKSFKMSERLKFTSLRWWKWDLSSLDLTALIQSN